MPTMARGRILQRQQGLERKLSAPPLLAPSKLAVTGSGCMTVLVVRPQDGRMRMCGVACGLGRFGVHPAYFRERMVAPGWRETTTGGNLGRGPARGPSQIFVQ